MVRDALVPTLWKDQWEQTLLPISGAQGFYMTLRHSHNRCHRNSVASLSPFMMSKMPLEDFLLEYLCL